MGSTCATFKNSIIGNMVVIRSRYYGNVDYKGWLTWVVERIPFELPIFFNSTIA